MRVKILRGVQQSPKGDPCREHALPHQGGEDIPALFVDVSVAFFDGVVIKMDFVVADLIAQRILFTVGGNDNLQRARAEVRAECLAGHFFVNGYKHFEIIPIGHYIREAGVKWL